LLQGQSQALEQARELAQGACMHLVAVDQVGQVQPRLQVA
jgi:hypothetical protein